MRREHNNICAYTVALVYIIFSLGCQNKPLAQESPTGTLKITKGDDSVKVLSDQKKKYENKTPEELSIDLKSALQKVHTNPGELPSLKVAANDKELNLPLKKTHVKANIVGYVAEVEVTQSYENTFKYPIEAIYIFPLPENSAVNDMKMIIGERVIEAKIKKRADAKQTYETAVKEGHTAALLEQERPNIFTQSVANIAPLTAIDVKITYIQNLTYDAGEYEFVFPMVVGPRFIPGNTTGSKNVTGWAQDTLEVPDAARITPALVGSGMRTGHDISLELHAEAGFPITSFSVPTHKIKQTSSPDGSLSLELASSDKIPNRDFVLKFNVGGADPQASFLTHKTKNEVYFSLLIQPPKLDMEKHVGKREIIFVVDVSGSMSGLPLAMCKHAVEKALNSLRPIDTFNVITFESRTAKAFDKPRPANGFNINAALEFVSGMRARGGTMMNQGVKAAFANEAEKGRHKYIFFMTDGYIGNESAIMSMIHKFVSKLDARDHRARVFSLGVGSSVNRHLLNGIANAGNGLAVYATNREDPTKSMDKIFRYIDHPIIEDIQIDWGDVKVQDVYPENPGDLFASHPVIVHGKFLDSPKTSTISIKGSIKGIEVNLPVQIDLQRAESHSILPFLWARSKIDWLEKSLIYEGHSSSLVNQITELGLSYRMVTSYTSFVAVDRLKKVNGKMRTIAQPVETPEGVDPHMAGAKVIIERPMVHTGKPHTAQAMTYNQYGIRKTTGTSQGGGRLENLNSVSGYSRGIGSYGRGAGGLGGKRGNAPSIRLMMVSAQGALSKEVIRRIIYRHINEVRNCYNQALSNTPGLSGRIVLKIVISNTGQIESAIVESSSLNNEGVENCLIKSSDLWKFPKPNSDKKVIATVHYIFNLPNK